MDDLSPPMDVLTRDSAALLQWAVNEYKQVVYSASLGVEAVLLADLICEHAPAIDFFTIDTGRLHSETLSLLERMESRFKRKIRVICPDTAALETYVCNNGINGFYSSVEQRHLCCEVRKIGPFKRGIAGSNAWVTGIRRSQSRHRAESRAIDWDERFGLWKVSPLLEWSDAEVWAYVRAKKLPYNLLHDKGYPSIGCAPCTRAVEAGADPRSGRWWWESTEHRECGIQFPVAADH